MRSILFVQPSVQPPGGGNGVAAWMLQTAVKHAEVTLLSVEPFQAVEVDRYYGTSLSREPVKNIVYAPTLNRLLRATRLPTALLQNHLLMRAGKKHASSYDLVCSAFNEQDFGRPAIEYIHYPWNLYPRPDAPPGWNESPLLRQVMRMYVALCKAISGFRTGNRTQNLTLVNSDWTGRRLRRAYPDTPYRVLHPPALSPALEDDRERREPRFLAIGRVAQCKEWEKLIDIVSEVRGRGHKVGLTLAGSRDDRQYEEFIRRKIRSEGSWAELRVDLKREELLELMRTHQYGLHGMVDEHYGMAVAELILGGCLTVVPNDGGQTEIVQDPRLRYNHPAEAVEKICSVLESPNLEEELLEAQKVRGEALTLERFTRDFETLLLRCLNEGVERVVCSRFQNLLE